MRCTTALSYADRIGRVVRHISDHLDDRLSVDDLSGVAALSPYHFHRIYRAIVGETTTQTVRRLRLHRAAAALIETELPVPRIAQQAGYGSVEAFTRAFGQDYGLSPAAYRLQRRLSPPSPTTMHQEIAMYQVHLKPFAGATLAVLPHTGSYQKIGTAFEQLSAWAGARGILGPKTQMIGIYLDDPQSVPESALRSYAGFTVDPGFVARDNVQRYELPACETATLVHKGPYAELPQAYDFLFSRWLPTSGREPSDIPCFEVYLSSPQANPPTDWLTEVALPLAR